jgi:predicted porin
MKQLPLVVALGAASLCSLSHAQSVQVYGKLYPYVEQESSSGQTAAGPLTATLAPATTTGAKGVANLKGMSAGNSNLGLRGKEDLGGGLRAEFQIEGTVAVDTGSAAGFLWNRNTFVGLETPYGEVRLGLMDTVQKEYGDTLGIVGISSGTPVSSSNVLRKIGYGTNSNSRFHERRANSIRYDSPVVGNFQAALQVATQEAPVTVGALTGITGAAKTWSMGLKFDNGPLFLSVAYEIHDNWYGGSSNARTSQSNIGTSATSKDTALQAVVEWRITKDQKLEFDLINKQYKENATATATGKFQNYKNTAWMVAYDGRFAGDWRLMAHYVGSSAGTCAIAYTSATNAGCSTDGLKGSQLTAGLAYNLSRRSYLFAAYSLITNGSAGRFNANDLSTSPSAGEDSRHLLAGFAHSF